MIISASRRTDIPAFYSRWFMNRLAAGHVQVRNPFNAAQTRHVSLEPGEVDAIVFWTRDASPLLPHLPELDRRGHAYYFQYTVTGYPRALERSVPRPEAAVETFKRLAGALGPRRVLWRYDPVLLSALTDVDEHRRLFASLAKSLAGHTGRVTISFADFYRKTARNLAAVDGLAAEDIAARPEALENLCRFMAEAARDAGMEILTCSEAVDLSHLGIGHAACVDGELLREVFGLELKAAKDKTQRPDCRCVASVDIGAYDTCLHGCTYCYATANRQAAQRNAARHDPDGPFLVGP
jgi:DNA repair photolyase